MGATRLCVLVCAALLTRVARADTPVSPPGVRAEVDDPASTLARAVDAYRAGSPAEARQVLLRILATGPTVSPDVRRDALAWLSEILLAEQGPTAARSAMEALLDEAPTYRMDPFVHSPNACEAFDELRAEREAKIPIPLPQPPIGLDAPPRPPWPADVLVPGGVHYFRDGQPGAGSLVAGLQVGGAAASVTTGFLMLGMTQIDRYDEDGRLTRFNTLRGINIAATVVGWSAYAIPVVVETARWRRPRVTTVGLGPTGATLKGTF